MAQGTRGKTLDTDKAIEGLKLTLSEEITKSVSANIDARLTEIKDLIQGDPDGVDTRLKVIEGVVVSNENALVPEVANIRGLVGPFVDPPPPLNLQEQISALRSDVTVLQNSETVADESALHELNFKVSHLCDAVGILERKVHSNESRILKNAADLLSNNLKLGGIGETPDEDPVNVAQTFFENILGFSPDEVDIVDAYRMKGNLRRKVNGILVDLPKLLYVQCSPLFRLQVEKRKTLVQNKFDELSKLRYSIRPHLPDAHYAARQRWNAMVKNVISENEGKADKDKVRFQFRGEEFYIGGLRVMDKIQPPSLKSVCILNPAKRDMIDLLTFFESSVKVEKESKFQAFAITVYGPEQIDNAYLKMRKDHMTATHICLGYRYLEDGLNSPTLHGAAHDGEYQADVKLIDTMFKAKLNNVAVFVVRRYGGVHIGGKRLSLIHDTALEAINLLRASRGEDFDEESMSEGESVHSAPAAASQGSPQGDVSSDSSRRRQRKSKNKTKGQGRGSGPSVRGSGPSVRGGKVGALRKPKLNVATSNVVYL